VTIEAPSGDPRAVEVFVIELGAALNAIGEPVYSVQHRLAEVARSYGAPDARVSAFPTYLMVTMGAGEPALLELTSSSSSAVRLDQISDLDHLLDEAERGAVPPVEGLQRLDEMRVSAPRFNPAMSIFGYALFSLGVCLLLRPSVRDLFAATVLGALVGILRSFDRGPTPVQTLMPIIAAFVVSGLSALAVKYDVTDPGIRAMVASLVTFLPGATLTTAVLELAAGQMVSGAARLVSGAVQLFFLAFGILAGIQAVGIPSHDVLIGSPHLLGTWAPWVGVLVFAVGVTLANSAPRRSFTGLLIVLYAAWAGQVLGNAVLGGYASALVGAAVMTPVAYWASRLKTAMPPLASFLPGYWLLVPGALGLIGLTQLASDGGSTQDIIATVVSLFAVAIGVLFGTLFVTWTLLTGRAVGGWTDSLRSHSPWLLRKRRTHRGSGPLTPPG
jgi:uncharacterized membrane protein YjjP (DUF1212 family)